MSTRIQEFQVFVDYQKRKSPSPDLPRLSGIILALAMPPLLELDENQLEWIIDCLRQHSNDSEFQTSIIHLLESLLVCLS